MAQANIPINKGNYSMETPEREESFHKKLSFGWEKAYAEYRKNWSDYPLRQHVADYPLLVDLELSTACNLKCPMCYTVTEGFKKRINAEFMNLALFKKIIDEIAGKVCALRLSLRGEPTLHPHFIDCVKYAKDKGVREVSCLTNGSKMTGNFFTRMMEAGLDWLTISVDGTGVTYEKIRAPLKFQETLKKIKGMKAIKESNNKLKPVIKIQAVWPAIRENPEEFYITFASCSDLIAFNPLIDYLAKDESIKYESDFVCPQHYQRLVIGTDGLALMCSNDDEGSEIVGDASSQKVHEIWHGRKLNKLRAVYQEKDGFMKIAACRKCYLPRLTQDGEVFQINGTEFIVKNYVNRKQGIGE